MSSVGMNASNKTRILARAETASAPSFMDQAFVIHTKISWTAFRVLCDPAPGSRDDDPGGGVLTAS